MNFGTGLFQGRESEKEKKEIEIVPHQGLESEPQKLDRRIGGVWWVVLLSLPN